MSNLKAIFNILILIVFMITAPQVFGSDDHDHSHEHAEHEDSDEYAHDEHGREEHGHNEAIELTQESLDLGGIETAKVMQSSFAGKISVSGRIAQDVEEVKYVFSTEPAKIEECSAALGAIVKEGEVLCHAILASNDQHVEIKAPISGTIISEFVKTAEHVDETTALYAIADFSKIWANFAVYEKDVASVKLGQTILVYPLSYPDQSFEGKIVFISPRVDESTYTVKIRAEVENKDYLIKLGMSVRGEILVVDGKDTLSIPTEAIQTVENKTVVFKKTEEGSFVAQEIKIASQTKETASILEGLQEGDEIVVKGSFILKSKMLESEMGHSH